MRSKLVLLILLYTSVELTPLAHAQNDLAIIHRPVSCFPTNRFPLIRAEIQAQAQGSPDRMAWPLAGRSKASLIEHQVDIAAYRFTQAAVKKISDAGGKALKIIELAESNPKGSNIKLIA